MRKFLLAAAVVVAAALIFGGATLASTDKRDAAKAQRGVRTFTIYAPTAANRIAFLPVTANKFSLGDRVVFSDDLFTSKGGRSLGIDGGTCTVVRIIDAATQSGVLQCELTFRLPGGQITTQQLHTLTKGELTGTQSGAITGGTRKYHNARGEVAVRFLSTTEAYVTFRLNR
jgi:hypothetical protein